MRTKEFSNSCFYNALVELLKTKSFEEIQIQEICLKAGYNRSTFYRSYTSKVDVLLNEFKKDLNKYEELVLKSKDYSFIDKTKLLFDLLKEIEPVISISLELLLYILSTNKL